MTQNSTATWEDWLKVFDNSVSVPLSDMTISRHHHTPKDFSDAYFKARENFEADFQKGLNLLDEVLNLPEQTDRQAMLDYVENLSKKLDGLQQNDMPSIPALRAAYYHLKGIDPKGGEMTAHMRASFTSAVLASITNSNPYHGNRHFREVPLIGVILTEAEMKYGNFRYSFSEVAEILISHDIHDLFHTGRNNVVDGNFVACFLESRSFEAARPYLKAVGLGAYPVMAMEVAVRGTEAAPDPALKALGGVPRSQLVGRAYMHHFYGDAQPALPADLKFLLNPTQTLDYVFNGVSHSGMKTDRPQPASLGARASRIAENMRMADIFASLTSFNSFKLRYGQLHEEFPANYGKDPNDLTAADWKNFIRFVVGGKTDAAGNFTPVIPSVGAYALIRPVINDLFVPAVAPAASAAHRPQ